MTLLSALQTARPPLPPPGVSQLGNAVVMSGFEGARPAAAKSDSENMELKRRRLLPRNCPRCQQRLSEYEVDLNCQFAMCPNLDCTFPFDAPRLSEYFAHDDTVLPLRKRLKSRKSAAVTGIGSDGRNSPTLAAVTAAVASGKENAASTRRPLQDGRSGAAIPGKGAGAHRSHSFTSLARVWGSISGNNGGSGAVPKATKAASYLSLSSSSPPKVAATETSIDSDGVDASGKGATPWVDFAALDPGNLLDGIFRGASAPKSIGGGGGADDSIIRELFAKSSTLFGGSFLPTEVIAASYNISNSNGSEHGVGSGRENTPQLDLDAISNFIASSDIFRMPATATAPVAVESHDSPTGTAGIDFDELFGDGSSAAAAALASGSTSSTDTNNSSDTSSSHSGGPSRDVADSLHTLLVPQQGEGKSQGENRNSSDDDLIEHLFS